MRVRPRNNWARAVAIIAALTAALAVVQPATAAPAESDEVDFWLTVLHNNDGESDLLADEVVDGVGNVVGFEKGVAYFASTLRDARTAANQKMGDNVKRGTIFVSSGDNFLASPSFTASVSDGVFYDGIALDSLGYDAISLGNHDFDFGPEVLAEFISEGFARPGHPPYVSANIDVSGEPALQALADTGVITGSTVVKKSGEEIGIVGAVTSALPTISSPRNVIVNEVAPAVQAEVDALEAAGVDKIVMISHLQDINGDIALAGLISGLDVMVAGGGDELLASPDDLLLPSDDPSDVFGPYPLNAVGADGADIPVVTTSGQYGYVGNLTVGFDDDGDVVTVDDARSGPIRVVSEHFADGVRPSGSLDTRVVAPVESFIADLAANVIATSEVDLDGRRSSVRSVEANEGNLLADALRWQATKLAADFGVAPPDVAMQNGGGIRNNDIIPAGDFTELDTFDIAPFPNFVSIVDPITREQFKELLENAVSRIPPAAASGGSGRFSQISGFSFTYDTAGTPLLYNPDGTVAIPGSRIVDVALDDGTVIVSGGVVNPGPGISVATNDFSARGGDQWFSNFGATFTSIGVSYQQALSNYVQAADGLSGVISAADYPAGGEGRITRIN